MVIFYSYVKLPEGTILALGRLSRKKESTIHVCPQPLATSIGKSSTDRGIFQYPVLQNHKKTAVCNLWGLGAHDLLPLSSYIPIIDCIIISKYKQYGVVWTPQSLMFYPRFPLELPFRAVFSPCPDPYGKMVPSGKHTKNYGKITIL